MDKNKSQKNESSNEKIEKVVKVKKAKKKIKTLTIGTFFGSTDSRNCSGKFLKMFYATQIKNKPPTIKCYLNFPEGIHFSYRRYLINSIRKSFGLMGTPIRLILSGKKEGP